MKMMQVRKRAIHRDIEAAAAALGFPRRVSFARVVRELNRYTGRVPELDLLADRPRFRAVAALYGLMDASRNLDRRIAAARRRAAAELRSRVIEQGKRTRQRIDEFIAGYAAWKALTPKQLDAILKAEMVREGAKRSALWEKNHGAKAAA